MTLTAGPSRVVSDTGRRLVRGSGAGTLPPIWRRTVAVLIDPASADVRTIRVALLHPSEILFAGHAARECTQR